jgi:hypothetical protein
VLGSVGIAGVVQGVREGAGESDTVVELLRQVVAAGWTDVAHKKQDSDLDSLRERDDFKSLVRDLEARHSTR